MLQSDGLLFWRWIVLQLRQIGAIVSRTVILRPRAVVRLANNANDFYCGASQRLELQVKFSLLPLCENRDWRSACWFSNEDRLCLSVILIHLMKTTYFWGCTTFSIKKFFFWEQNVSYAHRFNLDLQSNWHSTMFLVRQIFLFRLLSLFTKKTGSSEDIYI